jgi:hypothetical protein
MNCSIQSDEILSGTSGLGDVTALIRSSTTLLPDFLPACSISLTLASAPLPASSSAFLLPLFCYHDSQYTSRLDASEVWYTSDSNFLNSSSFFLRYSSISFCASDLASFTRFVRSGHGVRYRAHIPSLQARWQGSGHSLARGTVSIRDIIDSGISYLSGQSSVPLSRPV